MRILIAESDRPVASFLKKGLETEHYDVDAVSDGQEAVQMVEHGDYKIVILEVGLPRMEDFQVIKEIRSRKRHLPLLVLTGHTTVEERVKGLDLGADDYMTKPFAFRELVARIRALLRRVNTGAGFALQVDDLQCGSRETHRTPRF